MMRELVVGGDKEPVFSCVRLWKGSCAGQNDLFYIIDCDLANVRLYICKDSDIGLEFHKWISDKRNMNRSDIQMKALEIILPTLSAHEFMKIMDAKTKDAFNEGYRKAKADIREVLGI